MTERNIVTLYEVFPTFETSRHSRNFFRNYPTRTPRAYTIYHYTDIRYIRRFVKTAQKRRAEIVQNAENAEK